MNFSKQNIDLLKPYGSTSEPRGTQSILCSPCYTFTKLQQPWPMMSIPWVRKNSHPRPLRLWLYPGKHNESKWKWCHCKQKLEFILIHVVRNESFASLNTFTTSDIVMKSLATPLTADGRQHSSEHWPAIKNHWKCSQYKFPLKILPDWISFGLSIFRVIWRK